MLMSALSDSDKSLNAINRSSVSACDNLSASVVVVVVTIVVVVVAIVVVGTAVVWLSTSAPTSSLMAAPHAVDSMRARTNTIAIAFLCILNLLLFISLNH